MLMILERMLDTLAWQIVYPLRGLGGREGPRGRQMSKAWNCISLRRLFYLSDLISFVSCWRSLLVWVTWLHCSPRRIM